jgi:aspartate kinase
VIVMKFGGSSIAEAPRIVAVAELVRAQLGRRPVVVVSALASVTDLLEQSITRARAGDLEGLDSVLADLERRHRWALAGSIEDAALRHALSLDVQALFDDLRLHLRSLRVLGEVTPRTADGVLAFGEMLSARIVSAAFRDRGLPARWIDPRQVMVTSERFGRAEPDLARVSERCTTEVAPLLQAGELPVIGGYVGATAAGETTTLGRGGSDTSAAVLGLALGAEEIQIWTDVDGWMSADPRLVPAARRLERLSFVEAAELAFYGAKVLHPHAIAPAVRRQIPVRVLNSLRPDSPGTVIVDEAERGEPAAVASLASRGGACLARVHGPPKRADPSFLPHVLEACERVGAVPDLVVSSELAIALVAPGMERLQRLASELRPGEQLELLDDRAILCVVGSNLSTAGKLRGEVLAALAAWEPEVVALGGSRTSVAAVLEGSRLAPALSDLHRRFFE